MIHEVFTPIEDPQMAKTCSEVFRGEYRFVQTDQDAEQYGQAQAFLTHPDIELLTVQLNYLEESPSGELWSPIKFANLQYKLPSKQRIIDNYAQKVGKYQQEGNKRPIIAIMSAIPEFENGWRAVSAWFEETVAQTGNSLAVAHILGRNIKDQSLVDTIVYPSIVQEKLRLLARQALVSSLTNSPPDYLCFSHSILQVRAHGACKVFRIE